MEVTRVDKKGRLLLPKKIREMVGIREGGFVRIEAREKGIVVEPLESIADKYLGAFKIAKWPEDLDEFVNEVMKDWWIRKAT